MTLLDQVFKGSDVKYDIDGYQISLKKVAAKLRTQPNML